MQTCKQCGFQFHLLSQRFYCCDSDQPVCSVCRRKTCNKCKKPRTNQIIIPSCDKCHSRLDERDLLLQTSCGKYFCSACLSQIFQNAYCKVSVKHEFSENDSPLYVRLYCGHDYPYENLIGFFQHFCVGCGKKYDSQVDFQLNDGIKLCFMCYQYYVQAYKSMFISCEICRGRIENSSKATIIQNSDIAICRMCTKESEKQEHMISQSRAINEQKSRKKENTLNKEEKGKFEQKKQSSSPEIKQSPKATKSRLAKLLKKPSISELKMRQQKRSLGHKTNSNSITSRFSNNFEQIDEQTTKSMGLSSNVKLKKQLSNQTFVQQYNIQIPKNDINNFVKCKTCNILFNGKVAYDLYQSANTFSPKTSLVQFSTLKLPSLSKTRGNYFICRVCYSKSSERQKSLLLASSTTNKTEMSNRPSKLQIPPPQMDYLKVGSTKRQMRSPSPSPNRQYNLTGSSASKENKPNLKQLSSILSTKSQIEEKTSQKQLIKNSINPESRHTMKSHPQRFMKCDLCRDVKTSLIATKNQGYLCDDCYYMRVPHLGSYLRR